MTDERTASPGDGAGVKQVGDQFTYSVRKGGLMRCCLVTLDDHELETQGTAQDKPLPCKWCKSKMIHRAGAWEWLAADPDELSPASTPAEGQVSPMRKDGK